MRSLRVPFSVALILLVCVLPGRAVQTEPASSWPPPFYAFCVGLPAEPDPSIADQTRLLAELGFDGVGYPLWLDGRLQRNLDTIDRAGLQLSLVYLPIDLSSSKPSPDPRVSDALALLKGRSVTVSVLLRGFPPGDRQGTERAVKVLRQLGDWADKSGLDVSIYHHVNDWTERFAFAAEVAQRVNHPRVGVNFNLCHWLKVEGDRDYRPVLRTHADRLFAVTINGAQIGADAWTGGLIQPLDRGDFDNRALLEFLREIGYRRPVGLMCYGIPDDAREHLGRSISVWHSWWRSSNDR